MDGLRTYAAPVEHQVPGASVAQAPEDGERATACYGGVRVGEPRWHAREHGVVRRGRPETCIRLRLGRLPECARVGDPVREEEAWWRQYRSRLGRTRARAGRTEEERGRADDDAHTQAGHGGGGGDVAEGEVWTAGDAASAEAKSVPSWAGDACDKALSDVDVSPRHRPFTRISERGSWAARVYVHAR